MPDPIEMSLGADSHGFKEPCIRWGHHWTNPFTVVRGDSQRFGHTGELCKNG